MRYAFVDGLSLPDSRTKPPSYNVAPSQELYVIRHNHKTGERTLDLLRWGLIPHGAGIVGFGIGAILGSATHPANGICRSTPATCLLCAISTACLLRAGRLCVTGISIMSTYSNHDLERIAEAIGESPAHVIKYANRFEAAAAWYRLYYRAPKGILLADTAKRMQQIANAARKLLRQLEVYDYRKAPDGPGDITLLEFLTSVENGGEDEVLNATAQIGRLAEIFAAIDAGQELERRGRKAAEGAKHLSRLISIKGRRGDSAVNVWLAEMISIYKSLTRKEPRISVVSSGPKRGKPSGPFFRFLEAASGPVECDGKPLRLSGVRERIRAISRATPQRK